MIISIFDVAAMDAFSAKLAASCLDTAIIFLSGPLGVGKTTFVRGFLRELGYTGSVKSPTYTLVESYEIRSTVFHFDFYRISDPHELELMGIRDYFIPHAICLVEWPSLGEGVLPAPDLSCDFSFHENGRLIKLAAHSAVGDGILERFQNNE